MPAHCANCAPRLPDSPDWLMAHSRSVLLPTVPPWMTRSTAALGSVTFTPSPDGTLTGDTADDATNPNSPMRSARYRSAIRAGPGLRSTAHSPPQRLRPTLICSGISSKLYIYFNGLYIQSRLYLMYRWFQAGQIPPCGLSSAACADALGERLVLPREARFDFQEHRQVFLHVRRPDERWIY